MALKTPSEVRKERTSSNAARVAALKLARGCADCGYSEMPCALVFAHLKTPVSGQLLTRPWSVIQAEIEVCEVVCRNCQSIRMATRGPQPWLTSDSDSIV